MLQNFTTMNFSSSSCPLKSAFYDRQEVKKHTLLSVVKLRPFNPASGHITPRYVVDGNPPDFPEVSIMK